MVLGFLHLKSTDYTGYVISGLRTGRVFARSLEAPSSLSGLPRNFLASGRSSSTHRYCGNGVLIYYRSRDLPMLPLHPLPGLEAEIPPADDPVCNEA